MAQPLTSIFPKLKSGNYNVTNPKDCAYNCVAWAAGETDVWWDHLDGYWPKSEKRGGSVSAYVDVFVSLGFEVCETPGREPGFEKIAIFGKDDGQFTYVAKQLASGRWTSKLGRLEDIEHHDLASVSIPDYGRPVRFLRRPR